MYCVVAAECLLLAWKLQVRAVSITAQSNTFCFTWTVKLFVLCCWSSQTEKRVGFAYGIATEVKNWTGVMRCRNLMTVVRTRIRKGKVSLYVPNAHNDVFRCPAVWEWGECPSLDITNHALSVADNQRLRALGLLLKTFPPHPWLIFAKAQTRHKPGSSCATGDFGLLAECLTDFPEEIVC
jgi:hypothetical protein